ncbi:MAG: hypothetical protein IH987_12850 [Planctomycetes bacterium]|nr:hypothetical protein [Planctomycetota bacterium]
MASFRRGGEEMAVGWMETDGKTRRALAPSIAASDPYVRVTRRRRPIDISPLESVPALPEAQMQFGKSEAGQADRTPDAQSAAAKLLHQTVAAYTDSELAGIRFVSHESPARQVRKIPKPSRNDIFGALQSLQQDKLP